MKNYHRKNIEYERWISFMCRIERERERKRKGMEARDGEEAVDAKNTK